MCKAGASDSSTTRGSEKLQPRFWYLALSLLFLLEFYLLFGLGDFVGRIRGATIVTPLWFEIGLPFWPAFSLLYFSLYPLMWLCGYYYRTTAELQRVFAVFSIELALATIIFVTFPTLVVAPEVQSLSLLGVDGLTLVAYRYADTLNLDYNAFPSLHVAFAFTARDLCRKRATQRVSYVLTVWALLIALSTLFTHQHRLLDVWAGLALSWCVSLLSNYIDPNKVR